MADIIAGISPDIWTRARDILVIALVPAFMWLTAQVQHDAEINFEVATLKAQLSETRQALNTLRQDYNALNLQMVEVKSALRGIQDTLSDVRKQLTLMDERQRAFESEVRSAYRGSSSGPPFSLTRVPYIPDSAE